MAMPVQANPQVNTEVTVDLLAVRRHGLVPRVTRALRRECCVDVGDANIVVGVSGGADSTALLLALHAIAGHGDSNIALTPVCVHHHLRPEAEDEIVCVKSLCAGLGLGLRVVDVHPGSRSGNLAGNARDLRYGSLVEVARELGAGHVAVGHHADDQFETMLMALCRGAGAAGLSGMRWTRQLWDHTTLIRPLLGVSKTACEDLCRAAGVAWCDDASNSSLDTVRGRIRRDVVPVLEALWPGCAERAACSSDAIDAARSALNQLVDEAFGSETTWDRNDLALLEPKILSAGLARVVERVSGGRVGGSIHAGVVRDAAVGIRSADRRPKQFAVGQGWLIDVRSKQVSLVRDNG